jgi:hypothetical protein
LIIDIVAIGKQKGGLRKYKLLSKLEFYNVPVYIENEGVVTPPLINLKELGNMSYQLKRDGEVKFEGTENECFIKLQQSQSQSWDWAMKNEGWTIERKPVKTYEGWNGSLNEYLQVGDLVDEDMHDHFLNVLPPLTWTESMLQCSEPHSHEAEGATYTTFVRTSEGWMYAGNCYRGKSVNII